MRALTPQLFGFAALKQALDDAARSGIAVTDEAQAMERLGLPALLVRGSPFNIKVTRAEDLAMAETILNSAVPQRAQTTPQAADPATRRAEQVQMRIGQGFDVHAFGEGDHVVLGGVKIPHPHGIVAHSDGDVVIHALCDAVLGALGAGDIGQHFPDSDPRYRGADSRVFLREVASLVARRPGAGECGRHGDGRGAAYRQASQRHGGESGGGPGCGGGANQHQGHDHRTVLGFSRVWRGEGLAASAAVLLQSAVAEAAAAAATAGSSGKP